MEKIVNTSTGTLNKTNDNKAINDNSTPLACTLRIEFRFFKKKLVEMPMAAILTAMAATIGSAKIFDQVWNEVRRARPPVNARNEALQTMQLVYMKTFWTIIGATAADPFRRNSL